MAKGFFISIEPMDLREAVLIIASHSKGGISEWLEMNTSEFMLWLEALKDLRKDGGK